MIHGAHSHLNAPPMCCHFPPFEVRGLCVWITIVMNWFIQFKALNTKATVSSWSLPVVHVLSTRWHSGANEPQCFSPSLTCQRSSLRAAYMVALAPHHPWFLRQAAEFVFLALPDRRFFLRLVCARSQREATPLLLAVIHALELVHSRTQRILAEHGMLELPWTQHGDLFIPVSVTREAFLFVILVLRWGKIQTLQNKGFMKQVCIHMIQSGTKQTLFNRFDKNYLVSK